MNRLPLFVSVCNFAYSILFYLPSKVYAFSTMGVMMCWKWGAPKFYMVLWFTKRIVYVC
jgi:hypothetical protein